MQDEVIYEYEKLTWKEIDNQLKDKTLIIPCGCIEQHGKHLPMNVDKVLAKKISDLCAKEINGIVASEISFGARSHENSGGGYFKENVYIEGKLLIDYYNSILGKYLENRVKNIILFNAHWENEPYLIEAVEVLKNKRNIECKIAVISWWNLVSSDEIEKIINKKVNWSLEHAGITETSLMMYFCPELVRMEENNIRDLNINTDVYSSKSNEKIRKNGGALSSHKGASPQIGKEILEKIIIGFENFYDEWNS